MTQEQIDALTGDQIDRLVEKLVDLQIDSILQDRAALYEIVRQHVQEAFVQMDEVDIVEMAEYHGVEVE